MIDAQKPEQGRLAPAIDEARAQPGEGAAVERIAGPRGNFGIEVEIAAYDQERLLPPVGERQQLVGLRAATALVEHVEVERQRAGALAADREGRRHQPAAG